MRLRISERDFETLSRATNVRLSLLGTEQSVHKWQFGIVVEHLSHQASIYAPLSALPGDYSLRIETTCQGSSTNSADITVTVEQVVFPPGEIPVVLLNGFQRPSGTVTCPTLDVASTFGVLPDLLLGIHSPWAFFDNCVECPDCSIEDLGAKLADVLSSLTYADGTSVPMFDVVAHSMGGLIVRSYLSGKLNVPQPGVFAPPSVVRIRKAVFIGTPQFGSFLAPNALTSPQGLEMWPGSQLLWDLGTWNNFGDDLRGVDAIEIVGDAGTDLSPGDSDGVVDVTSAAGISLPPQRVRVVHYCHIDPGSLNALTLGLSAASGRSNSDLCDPTSLPIAEVNNKDHATWQIISSFLTDTNEWQTIGTDPGHDAYLSRYLGLCLSWQDSNGNQLPIASASLYNGAIGLVRGPSTLFCNSFVPPGTSPFQVVLSNGTPEISSSFSLNNPGTYSGWVVKPGPVALHVTSDLYGGPGFGVASGSAITLNGVNLTDTSGSVRVSANGSPLTVSGASSTQVRAQLSSSFIGLVKLTVNTGSGSDDINVLATPAASVPSLALSTSKLQFSFMVGGALPQSQSIIVSNGGGGTLSWSAKASVSWITISSSSNRLTVSLNPNGFAPNVYSGAVSVAAIGAGNSPQTISVTLTVTAAPPTVPAIVSIVNAFGGSATISPNTWVTITGTNLAPDQRTWQASDFLNNRMPTALDGVSVTMNGKNAYVYYISANQLNVLTPPDLGTGAVQVQVNYKAAVSEPFIVQAQQYSPSFFTFDGTHVTATHADGSLVGPTSLYPGFSTPAKPNETVVLYANGFGPTSTPVVSGGQTQSGSLPLLPVVKIGGITATVQFAGLVSPGTYQFNVVVPISALTGDNTLTATYNGLTTQAGVSLAVQEVSPGFGITVSPTSVSVPMGGVQTFTGIVSGVGGVNWNVQEGAVGGTITSAGIYTAPNTTGIFHVVATSASNLNEKAAAVVTVVSGLSYTILHSFSGADGTSPSGALIQASDGHFYGTTAWGGDLSCGGGFGVPQGCGTIFRIDPTGTYTVIHAFTVNLTDPGWPSGSLLQGSDGSLYGTTAWAGDPNCPVSIDLPGCGTIFRSDPSGNLTITHAFSGLDGAVPNAPLIQASDGNFYGTTALGGDLPCPLGLGDGCGVAFRMDPSGKVTVLHVFSASGGINPSAALIQAKGGDFYGTANGGGNLSCPLVSGGCGTVFKIDTSGNLTVLYSFFGSDGANPTAPLIQGIDGAFYGTTPIGGASKLGAAFRLDATGNFTVLHSFSTVEGEEPSGLIQGSDGYFYGTTQEGGSANAGTIFKMDISGNVTVLHSFTGGTSNGSVPSASLVQGKDGNLYGVTAYGGSSGDGVIFRISNLGVLSTAGLH